MRFCPICKSKELTKVKESAFKSSYSFYKCPYCSVELLWPFPSQDELDCLYKQDYLKAWGLSEDTPQGGYGSALQRIKRLTFQRYLQNIKKYISSGRLLDIGCATGFFLVEAQKAGFEVYGLEVSPYALQVARKKFGTSRIYQGDFITINYPENFYDCITMFDVLEHFRDPFAVISKVKHILKPNGFLIITTPNTDSLWHTLMSKYWPHYKLEHLVYFNKRSIIFLANRLSFIIHLLKPVSKTLNLSYLNSQLQTYHLPYISSLMSRVANFMPKSILELSFRLRLGELFIILKNQ